MTFKDYPLLYLHSENARMSLKELGAILNKSPQRLKYSTTMLEKEGIVTSPYAIIDYSYFGLILFRVYFKGVYVREQEKIRIINELSANPYVVALYELTGEYDLAVEFLSPNPSRFNKEFKHLTTMTPKLNDYKIVLNIVTHIYPRSYLLKGTGMKFLDPEKIIGGDRITENITPREMSVLKCLVEKPTIRYSDLSKKTEMNVKTARSVMNSLMKRNILRGFGYVLDVNKLGVQRERLFLKFHNLSVEREEELMSYLLTTKEIIQSNKTVGDWDLEISIESFDKSRIRQIIMQIKDEFKDIIERFSMIEFYCYYKRTYLPIFLFQELDNSNNNCQIQKSAQPTTTPRNSK